MNLKYPFFVLFVILFIGLQNQILLSDSEIDIEKSKTWFLYNDNIENDPYAIDLQRELFYLGFTTPYDNRNGVLRQDFRYPVAGLYPCGGSEEKMFDYLVMMDPSIKNINRFCVKNGFEDTLNGSDFLINSWSPSAELSDQNGKSRQNHQYFSDYANWEWWGVARGVPKTAMDLWLFQAAHFRYNHWKAKFDIETLQTVDYTYKTKTGICKDSAMLLADLLCYYGFDARYVAGYMVNNEGPGLHAWVVLRESKSGNEYLLESTSETADMKMRVPPRTFCRDQGSYIPRIQVKQKGYFIRNHGGWTKDYTNGWQIINVDDNDPVDPLNAPGC